MPGCDGSGGIGIGGAVCITNGTPWLWYGVPMGDTFEEREGGGGGDGRMAAADCETASEAWRLLAAPGETGGGGTGRYVGSVTGDESRLESELEAEEVCELRRGETRSKAGW